MRKVLIEVEKTVKQKVKVEVTLPYYHIVTDAIFAMNEDITVRISRVVKRISINNTYKNELIETIEYDIANGENSDQDALKKTFEEELAKFKGVMLNL